MKKTVLTALVAGLAHSACAQGEIAIDNINNTSSSPFATANGLFWISTNGTPALITQDFNAAFYVGGTSNSLSPLAVFLLSNGTAAGDNGFAPGTFLDPSGRAYTIQGAVDSAYFQVQAWTGNFNSYASAVAGGAPVAQSPVFVNPVDVPPGFPPDLLGMPAMVLSTLPEPSPLVLGGLGGLCVLLVWRLRRS